ncbi:MAG: fibronectin type III domain-containing protein [Prevotella sp.]|nr:fibronectin type III domain-containing protein [Prevotella sp.]
MKKTAMTLLALFCFLTAARATVVQIGKSNSSQVNGALPLFMSTNYSLTQQIYTAAEIGTAGTINSIAFDYVSSNPFSISGVQMYMKNVTRNAFPVPNYMESISASDMVWEGTFSADGAGWVTIELDHPFVYDGVSNLLVCLYDPTDGKPDDSNGKKYKFRETETNKYVCIYYFSDTKKPTLDDQMNNFFDNSQYNNGHQYDTYHCNIKLDVTPNSCDTPSNFAVSDITSNGATFIWESEAGNYVFEYKKTSDASWTVVDDLTECTCTLSTLAPATDYDIRVKAVCGAGSESEYNSSSFSTYDECPEGKVCIGQGTKLGYYMPFNDCAYCISQQIYTADEIGQAGTITSLDFFKASTEATSAKLDIYITSTDQDELSNWIPVTTNDLVFSGTVDFADNDWTTITLRQPFVYDGEGNIAILVNKTGSRLSDYQLFYVFTSDKQQSLQDRDNATSFDPLNLPESGTQTYEKNRIRLGLSELPSCMKPKHVTVDSTDGTTAQVSWESDGNAWEVALIDENDNSNTYSVSNGSPNITLENLELNTTYSVRVRTLCGDDSQSEWTDPVSFTSDLCMPEDKCTIEFVLTDSWGDGWNGNAIQVVDVETGKVLGTFANENLDGYTLHVSETNTLYLYVCPGRKIKFEWISGDYVSECSYVVRYVDGDVIFEGSGALTKPVTHTVYCGGTMTGDANGDTDLDIKDVLAVVDYILGNAPEVFVEVNADIDGVEGITISDAVAILNLILAGH